MHFRNLFVKGFKIVNKKQNISAHLGFTPNAQWSGEKRNGIFL